MSVGTATVRTSKPSGLDRYFGVTERGSTLATEIRGGATTWLAMAYILFVNPAILGSVADHDGKKLAFGAVLTVTALVAGAMTIAMGLYGRYPFAIASGLGLNAFVAFTLVGADRLTWPQAMGVIVAEGVVITVLVVVGLRERVLNAIPMPLKLSIGVGIGLFIAFIGLVNGGIVVKGSGTLVEINSNLSSWTVLTFVIGLALASCLISLRVPGALLISIIGTTLIAIVINKTQSYQIWTDGSAQWPSKVVSSPDFSLAGDFSFGFWNVLGVATALAVVLSAGLSDFFDTMGTVIGIGNQAEMLDEHGNLPGMRKVLIVDSIAAAVGGLFSSSSNTTFIESASGVGDGARTGLASLVTGAIFLVCLFISPLAGVIPAQATAPVLVIVGYYMLRGVLEIDLSDPTIGIPAMLTMLMMPLTYSITNGVGAGFVSYAAISLFLGRWKQLNPFIVVVALIFAWYFIHGVVG